MKCLSRIFLAALIFGGSSVFADSDIIVNDSNVYILSNSSAIIKDEEPLTDELNEAEEFDFDVQVLIDLAKQARENAYCPYSKFKVGAVVLSKSGNIYTGCNVENAAYGPSNCAERTAIFKAVSEGEKGNFIEAIAIILDAPDYGAPCGTCRQVINEFADPDAIIIMATMNGNYKIVRLSELLPYAFKLEEGKK